MSRTTAKHEIKLQTRTIYLVSFLLFFPLFATMHTHYSLARANRLQGGYTLTLNKGSYNLRYIHCAPVRPHRNKWLCAVNLSRRASNSNDTNQWVGRKWNKKKGLVHRTYELEMHRNAEADYDRQIFALAKFALMENDCDFEQKRCNHVAEQWERTSFNVFCSFFPELCIAAIIIILS